MDTLALIFLVGVAAGFFSGMIGGGSGLILAPAQILFGLDPKLATTTTHFGFIGVSLGALVRFERERAVRRQHSLPLTIIALTGGLVGPYVMFTIDAHYFQRIVGALILLCIPLFLAKNSLGTGVQRTSREKLIVGYLSLFILFVLQVAFGAATGILAIFALVYLMGLSMIEANAALRLPSLVSSLVCLALYSRHGHVNFTYGLTLLVAMALSGYFGSHFAIKGGNQTTKILFASFAALLASVLVFR